MKKIFDVCLAIVIMLLPNFSIYAATFSQNINSEYKYAEISREQKMSVSHQEIVDAYQIPTDKIESMTTEELLSAYLNYPLLGDMFAYNTTEMGFHALRKQCNALEELLSRKDTGEEILNRYNEVELLDSNNADSASFENFFEPSALEILAAQPEIVANTDADTYALLRSAIYEKCTEKSEEVYSATKDMYYSTKKEVSEINQFENDKQSMIMSISKSDFNWNHTVKTPKKAR